MVWIHSYHYFGPFFHWRSLCKIRLELWITLLDSRCKCYDRNHPELLGHVILDTVIWTQDRTPPPITSEVKTRLKITFLKNNSFTNRRCKNKFTSSCKESRLVEFYIWFSSTLSVNFWLQSNSQSSYIHLQFSMYRRSS